jgi:hypothetical protein
MSSHSLSDTKIKNTVITKHISNFYKIFLNKKKLVMSTDKHRHPFITRSVNIENYSFSVNVVSCSIIIYYLLPRSYGDGEADTDRRELSDG